MEILGIAEGVALQGGLPQPGHRKISLKLLIDSGLRLFNRVKSTCFWRAKRDFWRDNFHFWRASFFAC